MVYLHIPKMIGTQRHINTFILKILGEIMPEDMVTNKKNVPEKFMGHIFRVQRPLLNSGWPFVRAAPGWPILPME